MTPFRERVNQVVDGTLLIGGVSSAAWGDVIATYPSQITQGLAIAAGGLAMACTGLSHINMIDPAMYHDMADIYELDLSLPPSVKR